MKFELSEHARVRCRERRVPVNILERIQSGTFTAEALEDDGRISNFHIVRVATWRYWVAIERDGVMVTVIPVGFEGGAPRDWFSRRLLNFRHVIAEIEELPVTSTRRLRRLHAPQLAAAHQPANQESRRGRHAHRFPRPTELPEALTPTWNISA